MTVAAAPASPWKGLAAFEDTDLDALLFFGRDREQEVIASNLLAARLTVLYGPSGVGKSSVLRAGVAYRLRSAGERSIEERGHPDLTVVVFDDWRGDPVADLRDAVEEELGRLFGPYAVPAVDADATLAQAFGAWSAGLDCDVLLILDQVEEYFVYHPEDDVPEPFVDQLPELVTARGIRVNVLLSLREDSLAKLDRFKANIPNVFSNYLRLDRLARSAAREAVLGPLERYNELVGGDEAADIEPALVDAVIDETTAGRLDLGGEGRVTTNESSGEGVETAYLQLVLARIWNEEREQGSRTLRLETLRELGGAGEIVRSHVRRALDSLDPRERDVAATIFNYLVTPSGSKIAYSLSDLEKYAEAQPDTVDAVVGALARERVLRTVAAPRAGDGHADRGYEIFHDVLADPVLAWRRRHDEERALERERRQAARRQRALAVVSGASLAALAVMVAVTAFALTQRSEAHEQAALARMRESEALREKRNAIVAQEEAETERRKAVASRAEAEEEKFRAEGAEKAALREKGRAESAAKRAGASEADARTKTRLALEARSEAIASAARAERSEGAARTSEDAARASERTARASEADAKRDRRRAVDAARLARGRQLAAQALADLSVDPEKSVSHALEAAKLDPSGRVEDVLRTALVALRVRAVLDGGGGALRSAEFSPDGALVLTAARGGPVRLFRAPNWSLVRTVNEPGVARAAFSPTERLFATAGARGAFIRRIDTGTVTQTLRTGSPVRDLAFSGDGRVLVTGGGRSAQARDVATGLPLGPALRSERAIDSVAVNADGTRVAFTNGSGAAPLYEVGSGRLVRPLFHGANLRVLSVRFSGDGRFVATTGNGERAHLWNARTGAPVHRLRGHEFGVTSADFNHDGSLVVTASQDGGARIWDTATGDTKTVLLNHLNFVVDARFSAQADLVVTASLDKTARVFNTSGQPLGPLLGHRQAVTSASFDPFGDRVVTASDDGTARVWDPRVEPRLELLDGTSSPVDAIALSPDGRFVGAARRDGTARIRPLTGGSERTVRHRRAVTAVAFDRRSRLLLTASADGTARISRIRDGSEVRSFAHGVAVSSVGLSPNAALVVTGGTDGLARIWNAASGEPVRSLVHGASTVTVTRTLFSPDGTLLLTTGADGHGSIWRARDGARLHVLSGHQDGIVDAAFSPNGRRVVTASSDGTARIWSARTGQHLHRLDHGGAVTALAFNRAGTLLATGSGDRDARTWRVSDGKLHGLFRAHFGPVNGVSFSADGRWLATGGPTTAGLWEVSKSRFVFFLRGHRSPPRGAEGVVAATFASRGWRLVTGSGDGTVRTYDCRICQRLPGLVRQAKARLTALRPKG